MREIEIGVYTIPDGATVERRGKSLTVRPLRKGKEMVCRRCAHFGMGYCNKWSGVTSVCYMRPKRTFRGDERCYYQVKPSARVCENFEKSNIKVN